MKKILSTASILVILVLTVLNSRAVFAADAPSTASSSSSSSKKMNMSISPLGLLIGYLNVDVDFKTDEHWSIGPTISYWRSTVAFTGSTTNNITLLAYSIGARANWFKNGVYTDGLYVSPILQYVTARAAYTPSSGSETSASASAIAISGLVGYHWFWDMFNMSLGAGPSAIIGASKVKVQDSSGTTTEVDMRSTGGVGLALDFMMGLTF